MATKRNYTAIAGNESKARIHPKFSMEYPGAAMANDAGIEDVIETSLNALRLNNVHNIDARDLRDFFDALNERPDDTWRMYIYRWFGNIRVEWLYEKEKDTYTFTVSRVPNAFCVRMDREEVTP